MNTHKEANSKLEISKKLNSKEKEKKNEIDLTYTFMKFYINIYYYLIILLNNYYLITAQN